MAMMTPVIVAKYKVREDQLEGEVVEEKTWVSLSVYFGRPTDEDRCRLTWGGEASKAKLFAMSLRALAQTIDAAADRALEHEKETRR